MMVIIKLHCHHNESMCEKKSAEEFRKRSIVTLTFKLTAQFVMEYMTRCLRVLHNLRESSRMLLVISKLLPSSLSPVFKFLII